MSSSGLLFPVGAAVGIENSEGRLRFFCPRLIFIADHLQAAIDRDRAPTPTVLRKPILSHSFSVPSSPTTEASTGMHSRQSTSARLSTIIDFDCFSLLPLLTRFPFAASLLPYPSAPKGSATIFKHDPTRNFQFDPDLGFGLTLSRRPPPVPAWFLINQNRALLPNHHHSSGFTSSSFSYKP
ncbi:hypothetical protein CROQUDRAFT_86874 [Cronartium quercuum f. sp. fusiforme G11]|uniref:Uncharacterized protein n=1 Tax=Cronartium quercuum f. sp. fusiforme G11 TaxID=708437 RepID=A0A9P6NQD5_9BASI|nr:hypothetical protein CROQUDRAFT_86874 [Cronartium quercuum f. sp. fusiforme G11]